MFAKPLYQGFSREKLTDTSNLWFLHSKMDRKLTSAMDRQAESGTL
jgi:hypothetical protein